MVAQIRTLAFIVSLLTVCSCQGSAQGNGFAPVSMGHSTNNQVVDSEKEKSREKRIEIKSLADGKGTDVKLRS